MLLAAMMCLGVGGLAACGQAGGTDDGGGDNPPDHVAEAEFSRADAAKIVADKAGFTGGENLTEDVKDGDKNSEDIYACVSRNIFGEPTLEYNFRPNEAVTRYDTAKISVYTYAALLGVEDENLEPGVQDGITDIGELSVEQRWFVHCANANGFIEDTDGKFEPGKEVTEQEFSSAIDKAVQKAAVEGTNYEAYKAKKLENFRTFPNAGAPLADKLDKFVVSGMGDAGQRLAVATLQGIVNRDEIKLYLDYGGYSWMSDYAIEKEYFDGYETPVPDNDYLALLTRYADYIDGAIVFDPDLPWSINTCVNIAAVEGRIVISPAMVGTIRLLSPNADIRYFSELGLDELLDAEKWCYNNLFEYMRRDVISWMYYERQTDWARDYVVQMKIPTMWVAGSASEYYDEDALLFAASVLQKYPANIPMLDFKEKRIDVLVSTTVIEVGIDVPNATVMVIFNSERFGLSQLHQLRGRVGRGGGKAYCFLYTESDDEKAIARLKVICDSNDGFKIAEKDFEFRGGGDFLGTRQSGKSISDLGALSYPASVIFTAKKLCDEAFENPEYIKAVRPYAMEKYERLKDVALN